MELSIPVFSVLSGYLKGNTNERKRKFTLAIITITFIL